MVRRVSQSLVAWFLLWDLALTAGAWVAAYFVRFHSGLFTLRRGVPDFTLYLRALPLMLLVGMIAYRIAGMYEVHRLRRFREELLAVAKGVGLMTLLVMATSFARQAQYESRAAMVMFSIGTLFFLLVARRVSWSGMRRDRKSTRLNSSHERRSRMPSSA